MHQNLDVSRQAWYCQNNVDGSVVGNPRGLGGAGMASQPQGVSRVQGEDLGSNVITIKSQRKQARAKPEEDATPYEALQDIVYI